ncbi:MAG: heme-binding protein [Candidatus Thiodiazotropha sp.]
MKHTLMTAILIAGISGWAVADEDAPSVNLKRLALESANRIALGAVEACRKKGIQIGVTVVDRDGTVQAVMRDTIAAQITVPISRMKAFTAANFNAATSALKSRANTPIGRIDGLVMSAGGLPIQAGGQLLGAVGVSGAPSGETDEECAQAGIDTIIDDLEMEM